MVKKTCILDLDETLVHSWSNPDNLNELGIYSMRERFETFHPFCGEQLAYSFSLIDGIFWGMYRPHLKEFFQFCDGYFDNVFIWSAGIQEYVEGVCHCIFRDFDITHPRAIWSRIHCNKEKGIYHKPIIKLINHSKERDYDPYSIDMSQTIIVDDKEYTFMENPNNGVLIPPYNPELHDYKELLKYNSQDTALLKLKAWLSSPTVRECSDIRTLDKKGIFNGPS